MGTGLKNSCLGEAHYHHIQGCGNRRSVALSTGGSPFLLSRTWLRQTTSLRLKLGFRAKKSKHVGTWVFPRFLIAQSNKREEAGRDLCVVSFFVWPLCPVRIWFWFGVWVCSGGRKAFNGSGYLSGLNSAQTSSYNNAGLVPVHTSCSQKG